MPKHVKEIDELNQQQTITAEHTIEHNGTDDQRQTLKAGTY